MKKKTKLISVRFTEEDLNLIKKICKKNYTWPGTWVRAVTLKELVRLGKRENEEPHIREKVKL